MLPAISGSKLVESQLLRCVKFIFGEVDLAVALQHILEEVGMDEMSWWHTQKAVIGAWKHYMTEEYTPAKLRAMYFIGEEGEANTSSSASFTSSSPTGGPCGRRG